MIMFLLPLILCFAPEAPVPLQQKEAPKAEPKGLEVMRVLPDSQAQTLKFQVGDVLLTYNDAPLNTFQDLRTALTKSKPSGNVIKVLRLGKTYPLKVASGPLGLELAER